MVNEVEGSRFNPPNLAKLCYFWMSEGSSLRPMNMDEHTFDRLCLVLNKQRIRVKHRIQKSYNR